MAKMKVSKPPRIEEILVKEFQNLIELMPVDTRQLQNLENQLNEMPLSSSTNVSRVVKLDIKQPNEEQMNKLIEAYKKYYALFTTHKATDSKGRYLYWDKIKRQYSKKEDAEKIWAATKINRLAGKKKFELIAGYEFAFCVPDTMQALLHFVDKSCGDHIMLSSGNQLGSADKKTLMIEEAITSAQLEGAATTRKVAKQLLASQRPKPQNEYEIMIVNNHKLMQKTLALRNEPLSIKMILSLHHIATENAIGNQAVSGEFRQNDDIHIADYDGNSVYQPPAFTEVPKLMEALCTFANTDHDGINHPLFIHPIVKAIMLHFFTGYIHPFGDGNGRTARALFYWFVLRNGYDLFEYISISRLLREAPTKYAKSYLYTENDDLDLTYFIYYQLDIIKRAIEDLRSYVEKETSKLQNFTAEISNFATAHGLNGRQIEILQAAVKEKGKIFTVKNVSAQFDVAENTARTDLKQLLELKLLGQFKSGNAINFIAPSDLKDRLI